MAQLVDITLVHSKNQRIDLRLPVDVPCRVLSQAVARAVNLPEARSGEFSLAVRDGNRQVQLDESQSLLDAGVMYGDLLVLVPGAAARSSKDPSSQRRQASSAYLVFQSGERFKLNPAITRIGRWAPGNEVDVDLTSYDRGKRVSRRHALIENKHGYYVILDDESTNGTLVNGTSLQKGEPRLLYSGDQILLGGEGGVLLRFATGQSGKLTTMP